MIFRPRYRNPKFDYIILTVILAVILAAVYFSRNNPNRIMTTLGILVLAAVFLYFAYLIFSIDRMCYILKNQGVFIKYGFTKFLIPYEKITFVGRVQRTNWKKIAGTEWRNYCVGFFNEYKLGIIRMFGVSKQNIILITTDELSYGITPYDNNLFAEQIAERWEAKKELRLYPKEIQAKRIWQPSALMLMAVINIIALIGQIILVYLAVNNGWVTVLDYNLLGELKEQSKHYELFAFCVFSALVTFHFTYSTDQLLKSGIASGKNTLLVALVFNIMLTSVILTLIFA